MLSLAANHTLEGAQRKRMWCRRLVARLWLWCKRLTAVALMTALVWGSYALFILVRQTAYFSVRTIEITGHAALSRQDILYYLAIPEHATLFELDLARMGLRLERHPLIERVAVRRQLPDTLHVAVQERVPRLAVVVGDQRVAVDGEGVVLRPIATQDRDLPQLMLNEQRALAPGMRLRQQSVQRSLDVIQAHASSPMAGTLRLVSCTVDDSGTSHWRVAPDAFVLQVGEGDVASQLRRLPPVVRYLRQHDLAVRSVDVSYRKRVVVIPES
jgi:cell division septal protein FtsQ